MLRLRVSLLVFFLWSGHNLALGASYSATPSNYLAVLAGLKSGDTVNLAAGTYTSNLYLSNLHGTAAAWITIQGPASGSPAYFTATSTANTVELKNCTFLAVKNLTLDGRHLSGPFGISANGGTTNLVHDIVVENCTIQNYDGAQQTDGISTKTPTWNWTIRGNKILSAGTGMYLGNSDGSDPFVAGVIENNLILNPMGYCLQIKNQNAWPAVVGLPTATTTTIIRNNVFIKNDRSSPDGDRPNLLVDGFPTGSNNRYEIYGNLFDHNPRESLFQFSGRVTVHDNIFVDCPYNAIYGQNHTDMSGALSQLKLAYVYNNTIYSTGRGIYFANTATQGDNVTGNIIFSPMALAGSITNKSNNLSDSVANAVNYVTAPSIVLGGMNFYPRTGQCTGAALNISQFTADGAYAIDFNGRSKGSFIYRGAYSGSGTNPGWQLQAGVKPAPTQSKPGITSALNAIATAGSPFSYSITASNLPTSFGASGLPSGLTVSTSTGVISGTPATAGTVNVLISASNAVGTGSATLILNVNSAVGPVITAQPASKTVAAGQTATFSVSASGTDPLTYQWQKNGASIAAASSASYTTPATTTADNGASYRCIVTNSVGSATSNAATLTVNALNTPPSITSAASADPNPASTGATVAFFVSATDSDGDILAYSWNFGDGVSANGASVAHAYSTPGTFAATATVTDGRGGSASSVVTVRVSSGNVTLRAMDQNNLEVAGAGIDVYDYSTGTWQTYSTGTRISLTVGAAYSFRGNYLKNIGPWVKQSITASTSKVDVAFWKAAMLAKDQNGVNIPASLTVYNSPSPYSAGSAFTAPSGANVIIKGALNGLSGGWSTYLFNSSLPTAVIPFKSVVFRAVATDGTTLVPNAQIEIYASTAAKLANNTAQEIPVPATISVRAWLGTELISGWISAPISPTTTVVTFQTTYAARAAAPAAAATIDAADAVQQDPADAADMAEPETGNLSVSTLSGAISFKAPGRDTVKMSAIIHNLPPELDPAGQVMTVSVAGAPVTLSLNKNGKGKSSGGLCALKLKKSSNAASAGDAQFTVMLHNGTWASAWNIAGGAQGAVTLTIPVSVTLGNTIYSDTVDVHCSIKGAAGAKFSK